MIPVSEILEKLEFIRVKDPFFNLFGSSPQNGWGHSHILFAPLSEASVLAFEAAVGARLPEDYREFITRIGNGGPGPGYGLYALPTNLQHSLEWYRRPFDPAANQTNGCLPLYNHGCGVYEYLIIQAVNPNDCGTLAIDQGFDEIFVSNESFLPNYLEWLDSAVEEVKHWAK